MRDDPRLHHPHPHHPHPHALHHVNSPFIEALVKQRVGTMADLLRLVETYQPALTQAVQSIAADGIGDPTLAVELLRIDEAVAALGAQRSLLRAAAAGSVAIIVPLPPHVASRLLSVSTGPLFSTDEDHIPPHLSRYNPVSVERLMPVELAGQLAEVEAIVFEAFVDGDRIHGRRGLARLLQTLRQPVRRFVHSLPHAPHRARLIDIGPTAECLFI